MDKQRILITDDNKINRLLLSSMLEDRYELLEAADGAEAISVIQNYHGDIDLILLDLVMPVIDGLGVLDEMNKQGWIRDIPVIVISAEDSSAVTRKAYDLGAEDYITRPFDPETVSKRIQKAMFLHSERKNLIDAFTREFSEKQRLNDLMINILSHIVEQRNGESGLHVIHIKQITELLLKELPKHTDKYTIKEDDIPLISSASSFHDIGKMAIPETILNKPGKLTPAEFEIMKTHAIYGYEMISKVDNYGSNEDEPLIRYAKNICRWHHEKWDGKGYPDHISGDEIPIEAQVVSVADVYDALTSERCYKPPFSHEQAVSMITGGECGAFNPVLLECLFAVEPELKAMAEGESEDNSGKSKLLSEHILNRISAARNADVSRNIRLLRNEEERHSAFKVITDECWFEYYTSPALLMLNPAASAMMGLPAQLRDPFSSREFMQKCGVEFLDLFICEIDNADNDGFVDKKVRLADGKMYRIKGKLFVSSADDGKTKFISGAIGKLSCLD